VADYGARSLGDPIWRRCVRGGGRWRPSAKRNVRGAGADGRWCRCALCDRRRGPSPALASGSVRAADRCEHRPPSHARMAETQVVELKVAHVVPAPFDARDGVLGGAERYSFELARHMSERVDTRLVTF